MRPPNATLEICGIFDRSCKRKCADRAGANFAGLSTSWSGSGSFITLPLLLLTGMDARAVDFTSTVVLFLGKVAGVIADVLREYGQSAVGEWIIQKLAPLNYRMSLADHRSLPHIFEIIVSNPQFMTVNPYPG